MSLRDLQNVDVHLSGLARLAEQRQQREDPEREWRECGGWSVPRGSSWPAVMEGGGERKCSVCNVRVPMANCGAGWCWPCYWHCAGKPAAALHTSKCAVYHCAPAGPAQLACPPCTGAAAVGTQQEGVAMSVAEKYSAALREADLEAGRLVVFAHAQQLVFAGLEDGCRRAPAARRAGKMVVSGWVKPAVVRFVEWGKRCVFACGCTGEEHCGALLDIFAAEAEVAVAAAWRPAAGQDLRLLNPKKGK